MCLGPAVAAGVPLSTSRHAPPPAGILPPRASVLVGTGAQEVTGAGVKSVQGGGGKQGLSAEGLPRARGARGSLLAALFGGGERSRGSGVGGLWTKPGAWFC